MDLLQTKTNEPKNERIEKREPAITEKPAFVENVDNDKSINDNVGEIKNVKLNKKMEKAKKDINTFENNFDRAKRRSFFTIAKENASNRLFGAVKLSPEDLQNFFSVEQDEYGNGVASREEYFWLYKTAGDSNIIPLDGYIQQPTKYVDGNRVPISFYVSFFFKESEFLKRCKNYYRKYNIDFRIIKLKTQDLWKIILKVTDPNNIIIKADE